MATCGLCDLGKDAEAIIDVLLTREFGKRLDAERPEAGPPALVGAVPTRWTPEFPVQLELKACQDCAGRVGGDGIMSPDFAIRSRKPGEASDVVAELWAARVALRVHLSGGGTLEVQIPVDENDPFAAADRMARGQEPIEGRLTDGGPCIIRADQIAAVEVVQVDRRSGTS